VLAEGSKVNGVKYEAIHDTPDIPPLKTWLSGLAGKATNRRNKEDLGVPLDLTPNVMRAVDYLRRTEGAIKGQGGDAHTYKVACKVRDFGVSEDTALLLMLDHWYEKCNPNSKEQFVEKKVRHAYKYAQEAAGIDTPQAAFEEVEVTADDIERLKERENNKSEEGVEGRNGTKVDGVGAMAESDNQSLMDKWGLSDVIVPVHAFHDVEFPPKDYFLYPWVTTQTISMLYGDAGTGKTWFALAVAHAITTGNNFGPWEYRRGARTLYMDAEMTGADVQYRLEHMNLLNAKNFFIYSDALGNLREKPKANIMSKSWRDAVKAMLIKLDIEFWIADNLASLTPSGDENTKEDWNPINQWLLDLRFHGISTLLLHHTNKAGHQRGTSARLDNIDFSLRLAKPKDYVESEGARFNVVMEKGRIDHKDIHKMIDVQMQKDVNKVTGFCAWNYGKPKMVRITKVLHLIHTTDMKNKDISALLDVSSAVISQDIRKLKADLLIDRNNKITPRGLTHLEMNADQLAGLLMKQEEQAEREARYDDETT